MSFTTLESLKLEEIAIRDRLNANSADRINLEHELSCAQESIRKVAKTEEWILTGII